VEQQERKSDRTLLLLENNGSVLWNTL